MNGKTTARARVLRALACLGVIPGLVLAAVAPAQAAPDTGTRAGARQTTPVMEDVPTDNITISKLSGYEPADVVAAFEKVTQESAADQRTIGNLKMKQVILSRRIDSDNQKSAALVQQDNSLMAQARDNKNKTEALNQEIDAHNAQPHDFVLPDEEQASAAYKAEADGLNFRQSVLKMEHDALVSQLSQLGDQERALADDEDSVNADIAAFNQQVDAVNSSLQQLTAQVQQVYAQEAQAEQSLAENPPSPAASMDQGGDASSPPGQAGPDAPQGAGDTGGDSPSLQPQISALREYARQNGTSVLTQPGTATLSPESVSSLPAPQAIQLGTPAGTYDGLAPEPNGHYKALEVRAPQPASQRQETFTETLARGGQARAMVNGHPVIIDSTQSVAPAPESVSAPAPDRPGSPSSSPGNPGGSQEEPDPRCTPGGETYVDYLRPDSHDRAQEGIACLTKGGYDYYDRNGELKFKNGARIIGTDATYLKNKTCGPKMPGKEWPDCWPENTQRGHLVAKSLGGSGSDPWNLVPLYRRANSPEMSNVEFRIFTIVQDSGMTVYYTATPEYSIIHPAEPKPDKVIINAWEAKPGGPWVRVLEKFVITNQR